MARKSLFFTERKSSDSRYQYTSILMEVDTNRMKLIKLKLEGDRTEVELRLRFLLHQRQLSVSQETKAEASESKLAVVRHNPKV